MYSCKKFPFDVLNVHLWLQQLLWFEFRLMNSIQLVANLVPLNNADEPFIGTAQNFGILASIPARDAEGNFIGLMIEGGSSFINTNLMDGGGLSISAIGSTTNSSLASIVINPTLLEELNAERVSSLIYLANSPLFQDPEVDVTGSVIISFSINNILSERIELEEPIVLQSTSNKVNNSNSLIWY